MIYAATMHNTICKDSSKIKYENFSTFKFSIKKLILLIKVYCIFKPRKIYVKRNQVCIILLIGTFQADI